MRNDDLRDELERIGRLPVPEPRPEFTEALAQRLHLVDLTPAPLPRVPERRQALARYRMVAGGAIAAVALSAVGATYLAGSGTGDTGVDIAAANAVGYIRSENGATRELESNQKISLGEQIVCQESGEVSVGADIYRCEQDQTLEIRQDDDKRYYLVEVQPEEEMASETPPDQILQPDESDELAGPVDTVPIEDNATTSDSADSSIAEADTTTSAELPSTTNTEPTTTVTDEVTTTVEPETTTTEAPTTTDSSTTTAPTTTVADTTTSSTAATAVETTAVTTTTAPPTTTTSSTTTTTSTTAPRPVVTPLAEPGVEIEGNMATITWDRYTGSDFGRYLVFQTSTNTEELPPTPTYPPHDDEVRIYDSAAYPGTLSRPVDPTWTYVAYKVFVLGRDGSVIGLSGETLLRIERKEPASSTSTSTTADDNGSSTTSSTEGAQSSRLPSARASTRVESGAYEHTVDDGAALQPLAPASATAIASDNN